MITPRQQHQLRLPLLIAGLLCGATVALLVTGHPIPAIVALVGAVAIAVGVLADIIILGGR